MTTEKILTDEEKHAILSTDPFHGDFGEQDDRIFSDRIGFARKEGECSFCDSIIRPGDQQRRMSAKFDGEMMSHRWCLECCMEMLNEDDEDE